MHNPERERLPQRGLPCNESIKASNLNQKKRNGFPKGLRPFGSGFGGNAPEVLPLNLILNLSLGDGLEVRAVGGFAVNGGGGEQALAVDPPALRGRLHHRVLAADLVGGYRHR